MKVVYAEVNDCRDCLHNKCGMCSKLGKSLKTICFDLDCPLPELEIVEGFTRYITRDKSLECCGNCEHWARWDYNKHLKTDLGVCYCNESNVLSVTCNSKACEYFKEVLDDSK